MDRECGMLDPECGMRKTQCGMRGLLPAMLELSQGKVTLVLTHGRLEGMVRLRIMMQL